MKIAVSPLVLPIVDFVLGLVTVLAVASPLEWLVHKFGCHSERYRIGVLGEHHLYHHKAISQSCVKKNSSLLGTRNLFAVCVYCSMGVIVCAPIWLVSARSGWFLLAVVVFSFSYAVALVFIHHSIHHPNTMPILERFDWFLKVALRHTEHHASEDKNFNLLLPLADYVFGTAGESKHMLKRPT